MTGIPYIKKKIGSLSFVWLQNSNLFVQLEEPAWFVFKRLAQNDPLQKVADEFSRNYHAAPEESINFVRDLHERIDELNRPFKAVHPDKQTGEEPDKFMLSPYSVFQYQLNSTVIRFSYATDWLENYIHPLISHLVLPEGVQSPDFQFELLTSNGQVVYRLNKQEKGSWDRDKSNFTKGQIFVDLINLLHQKTENDWLMTIHASAVTNKKKTILFSAPPGSGKTTLAALMQANGYPLIADDFVPFDKHSDKAYPFPVAMSVKEGSVDLLTSHYPSLKEKQRHYISDEKRVRYLPVGNEKMTMAFPVHEIVFVNYDPAVDFEMTELPVTEAFKLLLEQIWVEPEPENIRLFFERFVKLSFYHLTYSDNTKALNAIKHLFGDDEH